MLVLYIYMGGRPLDLGGVGGAMYIYRNVHACVRACVCILYSYLLPVNNIKKSLQLVKVIGIIRVRLKKKETKTKQGGKDD